MAEDWQQLYTSIAFDPGGRTGWSIIQVYEEALESEDFMILHNVHYWAAGEYWGDEDDQVDEMMELAKVWPTGHITIEDFVLRIFTRDRALLAPVRISAAFKHALRSVAPTRASRIAWQMEALALTSMTDERLQSTEFWGPTRGQPHARDSIRHNLVWLRRAKKLRRLRAEDIG